MPTRTSPSLDQLKRALAIAERIQELEEELAAVLGSYHDGSTTPATKAVPADKPATKKRTMSPEARERIAAAQRARWAKTRQATGATGSNKPSGKAAKPARKGKAKRTISPEARAKMAAAAKKRWAAVRAKR